MNPLEQPVAWLVAGPVLAALVAFLWRSMVRRQARIAERRSRPSPLRDAELVFVEQTFRSSGRFPIVARVDRAYRLPTGVLVLVELKTRANFVATLSDVIQLSAQRLALMDARGEVVARESFVVFTGIDGGEPHVARRIDLLSTEEVKALAERRRQLLAGSVAPLWPSDDRVCRSCGFRKACRTAGRRFAISDFGSDTTTNNRKIICG